MFCKPLALSILTLTFGALAFAATRPQAPKMLEPTEQHKQIVQGAGEWEGTITMFMPGAPETPAPAKQTVEAIGSYWTQGRFTCDLMGMPYVGTGCTGYDVVKKKYVGTWIDNMSSEFALMEGEMDPKTNALVMRWTSTDAATGKLAPHRFEAVSTGDSCTSTFYLGEGAGTKTMVIAMKRKGAKASTAK